jgi:TIR domain
MRMRQNDDSLETDFFISYNRTDASWAEWVAAVLEENGFAVRIQAWDFVPGSNFVLEMNQAAQAASRTIAIVSPDYLNSKFGASEWAAAFAKDPEGSGRQLIPVRVREGQIEGLLKQIVYIDLVGKTESAARLALLNGVSGRRAKPTEQPQFPGIGPSEQRARTRAFPGSSLKSSSIKPKRYMPNIHQDPTDLEKRRFVQTTFETIVLYFESALSELSNNNESIDFELKRIDAEKITAELFINEKSRRQCIIWLYQGGIAFSEGSPFGWNVGNSFNELLSLGGKTIYFQYPNGIGLE